MHAIEYKYAPPSFNDTWQKNRDRDPDVNLRNAEDYYLTRPRTETFKNRPFTPYQRLGMTSFLK
jgi:hypothetical protein